MKELAAKKELTVRCGPSTWKESDLADWKAEVDEAKAEWKKLLAELEAKEKEDAEEPAPAGVGGDE